MMGNLRVEGIHHQFGRQRVLHGVDLKADAGACIALFGANGSGKSTLLAILATRLKPRRGQVFLNDLDISQHGEEARGLLLYVGHHTHLYGHLTPMENLRFFADLRRLEVDDGALREAIGVVGLGRFRDRAVLGFSAGMRKRLALSRMLLAKPALLLLDEPYSALDTQGIGWLNDTLNSYLNQGGTLLLASHEPERVAALPHTPYRLIKGRLHPEPAHLPGGTSSPSKPVPTETSPGPQE
ncbi:MAG: heme ABC exporter ATP-binding protein CcmA [Magnetococcales bacterium]|nr:heme ABC exporter ATP-binding protein CcmA [Magnetococcales bacterium]